MKTNLIPVSKKELLEEAGIYFSKHALYKLRKKPEFRDVIIKISGKLFVNLEKFKEKFLTGGDEKWIMKN